MSGMVRSLIVAGRTGPNAREEPMLFGRFSLLVLACSGAVACGGAAQPPPPAESPAPPAAAAAPAAPKLSYEVITGSPEGFLVTSTLVSGAQEAVLIDAQFTLADAKAVAARVQAANKK